MNLAKHQPVGGFELIIIIIIIFIVNNTIIIIVDIILFAISLCHCLLKFLGVFALKHSLLANSYQTQTLVSLLTTFFCGVFIHFSVTDFFKTILNTFLLLITKTRN